MTWSMPSSFANWVSSSVADMNSSLNEAGVSGPLLQKAPQPAARTQHSPRGDEELREGVSGAHTHGKRGWLTKGGRCLNARAGLGAPACGSSRLPSRVCSLCPSLSARSCVYLGATKHTSMMRVRPADIRVYPNIEWTCGALSGGLSVRCEGLYLGGEHQCLSVVRHGPSR